MAPATHALAAPALYTNDYAGKTVAGLSIGADGGLAPLSGSPFPVSEFNPSGLGITPDGRTMVITQTFAQLIATRAIADGGQIAGAGPEARSKGTALPAISPNGHFAYVGDGIRGAVLAFSLGAGGSIEQLGEPVGEEAAFDLALTPDGRYLFAPNGLGGEIGRFAIQADGTPAPLPGPNPEADGGGVKGIEVTPDGRFAIVATGGTHGWLHSYAVGAGGGLAEITPKLEIPEPSLVGPLISPDGRFAYLSASGADALRAFEIGAGGKLAEVGAPVAAGVASPYSMAISDDGRFLFVESENGETAQAFAVAADGTLTKAGGPVASGGGTNAMLLPLPAAPRAALVGMPPEAGQAAAFNASGSSDAGATITGYAWDFGDGTTETTPGPETTHRYAKGGPYSASVTVLDDAGCDGFVFTGQDAYCDGLERTKAVEVDEPPTISRLHARHGKHGLTLTYRLDEASKVRLTIERGRGRRLRLLGTVRASGKEGPNAAQAPKRLAKGLRPGRYTVLAIATDAGGAVSKPVRAPFRVKKPGT